MLEGAGVLRMIVVEIRRRTSEIFDDDARAGSGLLVIVVVIFRPETLVLACLLLSHVASVNGLIQVEEDLSRRECLPFGEMWLIRMPW